MPEIDTAMLTDLLIPYAVKIAGALVLLIVAWTIAAWSRRAARRGLQRAAIDATLTIFLSNLARWTVLILALLAILGVFGFSVTAFAAVIGAAGLAIALAFQGTLSNFASGMMLLIFRPFTVGDMVEAAGIRGKVQEIQLFSTVFDTTDNRRLFVPNTKIFGDVIENETFHATRRVQVEVGADYDAGLDETRAALEKAIESVEGVIDEPASQVYLDALGGSSVDWIVRVWCATDDFWAVRERLTRAVKMHLDEAGIGIPYPNMDVHVDGVLARE